MAARSLGSGTISFGLVAIPIRLYPAAVSERVSFHLLHAKCGNRIKYQAYCAACDEVVDRKDLVKAYEFGKDQYIRVTDEELEAVEGEASKHIDITEFVPLAAVDPVYFDRAYYLGPDKGGGKAYHLLARALEKSEEVALARFILRGKESLVLVRAFRQGLILHTMYFHDEIRVFDQVEGDEEGSKAIKDSELQLALRLVEELASKTFDAAKYEDEHRQRVLRLINEKAEGRELTAAPVAASRGTVVNLMDALKQSLAKRGEASLPPRARRRSPAKTPSAHAQGGHAPRRARAGAR
jgi:DNA end-binding protein Ku